MYSKKSLLQFAVTYALLLGLGQGYSALEDARIIAEYKALKSKLDHPKTARLLVHQTNWSSVGSISTNSDIVGFPMVNIIATDDSDLQGKSTGHIRFLLTDLDFTGPDWHHNNKVTFMFTNEQTMACSKNGMDPMEPTCPRAIISGHVTKMDKEAAGYKDALAAFIKRHPAAENWMKRHEFYLCELDIQNIFVLDFYGGPHKVTSDDYYSIKL